MALWRTSDYFGWKGRKPKHYSDMTKVDAFWLIFIVLFGSLVAIPASSFVIVASLNGGYIFTGAVLMLWPISSLLGIRQCCHVLHRRFKSGPPMAGVSPELGQVEARLGRRTRKSSIPKIKEVGARFGRASKH